MRSKGDVLDLTEATRRLPRHPLTTRPSQQQMEAAQAVMTAAARTRCASCAASRCHGVGMGDRGGRAGGS